ncbi:MAG TPA: ABC transporter ATP-binding protein [Phycisphaerae bacterium]|nr:ABC transporter ATP-binding protein [Phycisphaerae bacterium]
MNDFVIQFEQVTKTYTLCSHVSGGIKTFLFHLPDAIRQLRNNRFTALDSVSFAVAAGESLGVIGPNGAGKSTTLALIAKVLAPTAGRVTARGRVLPLLELGAGFHPELAGRENIVLNGVLMGLTRAEVFARMDPIIEFSELGPFIDQPVRTYSTGMLGRLGFSVVANLDPEVLLVDEVLTVGDMAFQAKCMARMRQFQTQGVTMVFVSHDMHAVRTVCDRALWLERGRVRMIGDSAAVTAAYEASQPAPAAAEAAQ